MQLSVDQDGAGLTVTQQAVRVRKIRPEGDVPGLIVELALDRTELAGLRELVAVRQHEFDFGSSDPASGLAMYSRYCFSGTLK